MIKRLLSAIVLSFAVICGAMPAKAQQFSRSYIINTLIPQCFTTNGQGLITGATTRTCLIEIVNSISAIYQDTLVTLDNLTANSVSTVQLYVNGSLYVPPSTFNTATFGAAVLSNIPTQSIYVVTNGYTTAGDGGGATYIRLSGTPSPVKAWHFQSADGAWWQLQVNPVLPKQLGAKLDAATDDSAPMQGWLDYGATFGVVSSGQPGTAVIPTAKLSLTSGAVVDGQNVLTIKRTSDVIAALLYCRNQSNVTIRNLLETTTAGFTSSTPLSMPVPPLPTPPTPYPTLTFTVPAGLNLVTSGAGTILIKRAANADINMTAFIQSYSGTSLVVAIFAENYSAGTFSDWILNPQLDENDESTFPFAQQANNCQNFTSEGNTISGAFYSGIDVTNSSHVTVRNNHLNVSVVRGIEFFAEPGTGSSVAGASISGNFIEGANLLFYGIQTGTSSSGSSSMIEVSVANNNMSGVTSQGVSAAGNEAFASFTGNNVLLTSGSSGAGLLCQVIIVSSTPVIPQQITYTGNTVTGGSYGFQAQACTHSTISGNTLSANLVGGMVFNAAVASEIAYNTIMGNTIYGSGGNGISFTASTSAGNAYNSVIGNIVYNNTSTGIVSDANSANLSFIGNIATNNTPNCSIAGSGIVNANNQCP